MIKDIDVEREQNERLRLGQIAEDGLASEFWQQIVNPIIESQIKGITDITAVDISSKKKASIELAGRVLAAKYISEIETFIKGFIIDAETTRRAVELKNKPNPLTKEREE